MSKLWTEKLARDCTLVGRTVIGVMIFLRIVVEWITANQGTALLAIGLGIMGCAKLIESRTRKATALLPTQEAPPTAL